MKRLLFLVAILALAGDARLLTQRQAGPAPGPGGVAPPGRQGGGAPGGRQGGATPDGRQGGPARPARDRAPREGTAVIRGRVLAADTGTPLRRAEVQGLSGGNLPRVALTDADGRFELRGFPAGSVTLRASKTGFVSQQFGQRSPFGAGEPVSIADGQQLSIEFGLLRGGAITGRVFDDLGDPVANVRVAALRPNFTATGRRLVNAGGGTGITDDTGAYRLYGLAPGTYYVSATAQSNRSVSGETTAYAATYFPGTIESRSAERVTIGAGQEQSTIDFALTTVRTVPVSGTIVNSNGQPVQADVNLSGGVSDEGGGGQRRVRSSGDGRFTLPSVPPGNYVLEVTGRTSSPSVPPEVAAVPISVDGAEVTDVVVTVGRGASVVGTLATDDGSRVDMTGIRVSAAPVRNGSSWTPRMQVAGNASFELAALVGARTFRFEQLPPGWAVKSITANGVDVTDSFLEFRGIEEISLRVVLTSKVTQLTGAVLSNRPTRGAGIVVFAEDQSKWTPTSRYVRTARADDKGQFALRSLPGNQRYLAVALDYVENGEHLDPDFLSRLRPRATSVSLEEGEQARLDLTLQARP